jgi:uncharacterized membrane protein
MWHFAKLYVSILAAFMALDAVWLGVLTPQFYKAEFGALARRQGDALNPIWWAMLAVYLILPLGIIWFVLPRVSEANRVFSSASWGIVFGLMTYGIYDLTNYATLDGWSLRLVVVDMLWGGTICGLSTIVASTLDEWFS